MASVNFVINQRRQSERESVFPGSAQRVWNRKVSKGFTTVPRVIPLVCAIMDALTKGQPISSVYLDLWFKSYDEMYLLIESPTERAFYSGFGGQRAETTWTTRMRLLKDLGFIEVAEGTRGEFHHVLIVNPDLAVGNITKNPSQSKIVGKKLLEAYQQRLREVGAAPPLPPPPPEPPTTPSPLPTPKKKLVLRTHSKKSS